MKDENGNWIDLDQVDAIGRFDDGRFDVWMCNGSRVITDDPEAFAIWQNYIRSKVRRHYRTLSRLVAVPES